MPRPSRLLPLLSGSTACLLLLTAAPAGAAAPAPVDPATSACPTDRVERGRFADVPPGTSLALAVDCLAGYGIARGTAGGGFGPSALVTRGQMALFLDRVTAYALQATGSSAQRSTASAGFDDLAGQSREVVLAVDRLAAEGVAQGSDADRDGRPSFRPTAPVTRGQMAAFLQRTIGSIATLLSGRPTPGPSSSEDHFTDDEGSPFEAAIDAVASVGIAAGVTPTQFAPDRPVARQQMALFLARLLEVEVAGGVFPSRYSEGGRPLDAQGPLSPGTPVTVTRGLRTPWGLAPLPSGGALVSERDTALLKRVLPDGRTTSLGQVPGVVPGGEGGLLGIALSPSFASDALVYAYLTASADNRVVRFPVAGDRIGAVTPIVTGIPKGTIHNGGRIAFGPDGTLYVGTGDAGTTARSQDMRSSGGKVLRVTRDGAVPGDNPVAGSPVFSLGHRNVQGLAFDDAGRLWASELGQNTWDEVNLLRPGGNYGWPVVEGPSSDSRYIGPKVVWSPAEASPSGAAIAGGSLWVAALRGQRLWQVPLSGESVGDDRAHFVGAFGRLRAVAQVAPDRLWVLTNESDARVLSVPLG